MIEMNRDVDSPRERGSYTPNRSRLRIRFEGVPRPLFVARRRGWEKSSSPPMDGDAPDVGRRSSVAKHVKSLAGPTRLEAPPEPPTASS
jgi:hypothetical protein